MVNTELRKRGLSTYFMSDFQFEALLKGPKEYARDHGGYWSTQMLVRSKVRKPAQRPRPD
jgi:hypothetical protein